MLEVDANKDGEISLDEFMTAMTTYMKNHHSFVQDK
jgi:hypothetical protein